MLAVIAYIKQHEERNIMREHSPNVELTSAIVRMLKQTEVETMEGGLAI
jgi:hypothetical protein